MTEEEEHSSTDICRVCRCEATSDKPLFYPCICTGSIKYIHQDCLVQWLKYSRKEYCELCKHKFSFKPIYSKDMPSRLSIQEVLTGLGKSIWKATRYWLQTTLVAFAWLFVVPLTACRIYRSLFTGSVSSLLYLPVNMVSPSNIIEDVAQGLFVVVTTLCAFISLVWLREQILNGNGPDWIEVDPEQDGPIPNNGIMQNINGLLGIGQDPNWAEGEEGDIGIDEGGDVGVDGEVNNANAENGWNGLVFDRGAAEDLTWERLLGLDGSLVFLEHVFWVVSLNTLFILVFAFCPYHIGHILLVGLKLNEYMLFKEFDGSLTTLLGYFMIAVSLALMHSGAQLLNMAKARRILGVCYIVVKVSLLVFVEVGIFPLVCGFWLDACSLEMFNTTLNQRVENLHRSPSAAVFMHWLVGMIYVFYFASFILILREVLRPGVLWFLRNLNDPDFNPINEMIQLPVYRHTRRFLASLVIFGSTVIVMLWFPVQTLMYITPGFLPYKVSLGSEMLSSELTLELLLLQVFLPAVLDQGHTRVWLKAMIKSWCRSMAWLLGLELYLLGSGIVQEEENAPAVPGVNAPGDVGDDADFSDDEDGDDNEDDDDDGDFSSDEGSSGEEDEGDPPNLEWQFFELAPEDQGGGGDEGAQLLELQDAEVQVGGVEAGLGLLLNNPAQGQGLGAEHQAMLLGGGPVGFEPYTRPSFFILRLLALLALMVITMYFMALGLFIIPIALGRAILYLVLDYNRVHELYTASCGMYFIWLFFRFFSVSAIYKHMDMKAVRRRAGEIASITFKGLVLLTTMVLVVPLVLGVLFDLAVLLPLRTSVYETPILYIWQDWAVGVLQLKIMVGALLLGPQWAFKRRVEQLYHLGLRHFPLDVYLTQVFLPVITVLGLCLAIPYALIWTFLPMCGVSWIFVDILYKRIYPLIIGSVCGAVFMVAQVQQCQKLYEHIKNDKYLVGQCLVNYDQIKR